MAGGQEAPKEAIEQERPKRTLCQPHGIERAVIVRENIRIDGWPGKQPDQRAHEARESQQSDRSYKHSVRPQTFRPPPGTQVTQNHGYQEQHVEFVEEEAARPRCKIQKCRCRRHHGNQEVRAIPQENGVTSQKQAKGDRKCGKRQCAPENQQQASDQGRDDRGGDWPEVTGGV